MSRAGTERVESAATFRRFEAPGVGRGNVRRLKPAPHAVGSERGRVRVVDGGAGGRGTTAMAMGEMDRIDRMDPMDEGGESGRGGCRRDAGATCDGA